MDMISVWNSVFYYLSQRSVIIIKCIEISLVNCCFVFFCCRDILLLLIHWMHVCQLHHHPGDICSNMLTSLHLYKNLIVISATRSVSYLFIENTFYSPLPQNPTAIFQTTYLFPLYISMKLWIKNSFLYFIGLHGTKGYI